LSRIGCCHSLGWRVQGAFSPLLLDDLSPYRTSAPTASAQCERVTRHSHEKAGPCQAIFLVVSTVHQTADQREAHLTFSLSFLERFFLRLPILPMADQREAVNAAIPNAQIADSPYFHPHSFYGAIAPVPAGCTQFGSGAAVSDTN